ncbi:hypothetical protein ACVTW2_000673 [Escherichia coli]
MLTNQSLKDALLIVGQYKKDLMNDFLTVPEEKLISVRNSYEAMNKLERRLKNEIDGDSKFIKELNKEI